MEQQKESYEVKLRDHQALQGAANEIDELKNKHQEAIQEINDLKSLRDRLNGNIVYL